MLTVVESESSHFQVKVATRLFLLLSKQVLFLFLEIQQMLKIKPASSLITKASVKDFNY